MCVYLSNLNLKLVLTESRQKSGEIRELLELEPLRLVMEKDRLMRQFEHVQC